MQTSTILLTLVGLLLFGYVLGRNRSIKVAQYKKTALGDQLNLHSSPNYYGLLVVFFTGLPTLILLLLWNGLDSTVISHLTQAHLPASLQTQASDKMGLYMNEIKNLAENLAESQNFQLTDDKVKQDAAAYYHELTQLSQFIKTTLIFALAALCMLLVTRIIKPQLKARNYVETTTQGIMIACASVAILSTVGIVLSVLFESLRFFQAVPITEFLFGTHWSPQTAIRSDQVGSSGSFGAIPLFTGTLLISILALSIAVPVGLMTAIYLSEYASSRFRSIAKPLLEILAGIPTVVYGFFAALVVAPFIRELGESIGLNPSSESALAAGIVMGIMIIPFVSSLSDDVISSVPQAMRDGSYAMGATRSETIKKIILPAALPGIVGSILLASSRAIGETMIVVMAAGLAANLTANPLEAVTTVTVQIVTLITGDQEFDSPKTLAAFALGLSLFVVTLILNLISLHVVRKYREQYE